MHTPPVSKNLVEWLVILAIFAGCADQRSAATDAPQSFRDFPKGNIRPELVLQLGHVEYPMHAAVSPDDLELVTVSQQLSGGGNRALFWDLPTGRQVGELRMRDYARGTFHVTDVQFHPHQQQVLFCGTSHVGGDNHSDPGSLLVDKSNGQLILRLVSNDGYSRHACACFSPDGQTVLIGCQHKSPRRREADNSPLEKGRAQLWDLRNGQLLRTFEHRSGSRVIGCSFQAGGNQIATMDEYGEVNVWNVQSGALITRFNAVKDGDLASSRPLWFHPNGQDLVTCCGTVHVWDAKTGEHKMRLMPGEQIRHFSLSDDGSTFLAGTQMSGCNLEVYEYSTRQRLSTIYWSRDRLVASLLNHQGTSVLALDGPPMQVNECRVWDARTGAAQSTLFVKPYDFVQIPRFSTVRFSPDGLRIAMSVRGCEQTQVQSEEMTITTVVWNLERGGVETTVPMYRGKIIPYEQRETNGEWLDPPEPPEFNTLAWTADGTGLLFSPGKDMVRYDILTRDGTDVFRGQASPAICAAMSVDRKQLAIGTADGTVVLLDIATARERHRLNTKYKSVRYLAFSGDGNRLVTNSLSDDFYTYKGMATIWNTQSGEQLASIPVGKKKSDERERSPLAVNRDASNLLIITERTLTSFTNEAVLWTPGTNTTTALRGQVHAIACAVFSPDGKRVVTATEEAGVVNDLQVWDAESGELLQTLKGNPGRTVSLDISPDGKRVISCDLDKSAILWDLESGVKLATFVLRRQGADWLVVTNNGPFHGSADLLARVGWRISGKVFPVDLYAQRFHDPDAVSRILRGMDSGSAPSIPGKHSPPEAKIEVEEIGQRELKVRVSARSGSPGVKIRGMRIFVDGRDIPGTSGTIQRDDQSDGSIHFRHSIDFPANKTKAVVAAVVDDEFGLQSHPAAMTVVLPGSDLPVKRTLYVLAVGVSQYQDPAANLRYADADADALVKVLVKQKGLAFDDVQSRLMTDALATRAQIREGLKWLKTNCRREDMAIVSFSGHGARTRDGKLYYVPYDADSSSARSYLPWEELAAELQDVQASPVLFLADCCHSGAFGLQQPSQDELARPLLNDSRVMVFCSSRGLEYSLELSSLKHGAFTYALLNGLSGAADLIPDRRITISELQTYVANRVKQITEGRQHPHIPLMHDFDPEAVVAHVP